MFELDHDPVGIENIQKELQRNDITSATLDKDELAKLAFGSENIKLKYKPHHNTGRKKSANIDF
jgi:hypothetical protein